MSDKVFLYYYFIFLLCFFTFGLRMLVFIEVPLFYLSLASLARGMGVVGCVGE